VSKKAVLEFYHSDIIRTQIAAVLLKSGIIMALAGAGIIMGLVVRPVNP